MKLPGRHRPIPPGNVELVCRGGVYTAHRSGGCRSDRTGYITTSAIAVVAHLGRQCLCADCWPELVAVR